MKYLRFQSLQRCYHLPTRGGIFRTAYTVRDAEDTRAHDADAINHHLDWFVTHLKIPRESDWNYRAIFWFKDSAREPIDHIWAMKHLLKANGYWIDVVKTQRPGRIIYEDDWQIAAVPWRDAH
nr:hypothetical protein [Hyphomonas sp. Mor2]